MASSLALICADCQRRPPLYDQCISAWRFEFEIKEMIHAFKYQNRLDYGKALSEAFASILQEIYAHTEQPSLMIPVPLHSSHLRKRGFNQAQEICRTLSKHMQIPYHRDLIYRSKNTQSQHSLSADQRKKNLRNAFHLNSNFASKILAHTHIAIVDDVVTTSSTCNEISRTLKQSGITKIDVWSLARASRLH